MDGYQLSTYLENYLDSVSTLPSELKRNLSLIKELDHRTKDTIQRIDDLTRENLTDKKQQRRVRAEIGDSYTSCIELADEKIGLAIQTYDMVDKHIRRLDVDLRKFEKELEKMNATLATQEAVPVKPEPGRKDRKATSKKSLKSSVNGDINKTIKKPKKGKARGAIRGAVKGIRPGAIVSAPSEEARVFNVDIDMPIDPNEPTYCYCNRVSFGEMIGCDNSECAVEWFHFECVGLVTSPKGKWLCPDCIKLQKDKQ